MASRPGSTPVSRDSDGAPLDLSVVATARNDDHGGNLLGRMQLFVDSLLAQCREHGLAAELILVEWNPVIGQYVASSRIVLGHGYWLNLHSQQTITLRGAHPLPLDLVCRRGLQGRVRGIGVAHSAADADGPALLDALLGLGRPDPPIPDRCRDGRCQPAT